MSISKKLDAFSYSKSATQENGRGEPGHGKLGVAGGKSGRDSLTARSIEEIGALTVEGEADRCLECLAETAMTLGDNELLTGKSRNKSLVARRLERIELWS